MQKPLADILRPTKIEDMVGQTHLISEGSLFRNVIEGEKIPNMIFYGPPGIGKTTLANIIALKANMSLYKLNGTNCGTEDIKDIIKQIGDVFNQNGILLYLDEIQYLNKKQQQSLLEFVENGDITLIASTTENPYFYVYPALLSRCSVFEFKAISSEEIAKGLTRGAKALKVKIEPEALKILSLSANGDMRKALNSLEFIASGIKN